MRPKFFSKVILTKDAIPLKPGDKVVVTYHSGEHETCTVRKSNFENPGKLFIQDNDGWQCNLNEIFKITLI